MSHSKIDFKRHYAAVWRAKKGFLKPVEHLDNILFDDLVGLQRQKDDFIQNTERFLNNLPSNNILLWGSRGTGKSSFIKAMINTYADAGLRVIEVQRDDLDDLIDISDMIRDLPFKFIIFCDDLSFEEGERGYRALKTALEGSIETPPDNIKIYATSNRRHLVVENMADNNGSGLDADGQLHYSDTVEEKISLSDRFGLWISFYQGNQEEYLKIVDSYFKDYTGNRDDLHMKALQFAQNRASKSGRTAKQFYNSFSQHLC